MQDVYILHSLSEHISDRDEFDIEKLINSGTNLTDELQLASHVATYDASSGLMVIHLDPPVYASSLYVARRENESLVVEEIYIFACKPPGKMMMMIVVHLWTDLSACHATKGPWRVSARTQIRYRLAGQASSFVTYEQPSSLRPTRIKMKHLLLMNGYKNISSNYKIYFITGTYCVLHGNVRIIIEINITFPSYCIWIIFNILLELWYRWL